MSVSFDFLPFGELGQQTFRSVIIKNGNVSLERLRHPGVASEPSLLVTPLIAGVCRSDYKELQGVRAVRSDFGHEIVGILKEVSPELNLNPGELVGFNPHPVISRSSGFGDLVFATGHDEQLRQAFIPLPTIGNRERFVFLDPLACVLHAVQRLPKLRSQSRALVLGAGISGILFAFLLSERGFRVTLTNRSEARLSFTEYLGFSSPTQFALFDDIEPDAFDVVVIATAFSGMEQLLLAERAVSQDGCVLIFGGTDPTQPAFFPSGSNHVDAVRRQQQRVVTNSGGKSVAWIGTHGAEVDDYFLSASLIEKGSGGLDNLLTHLIADRVALSALPGFFNRTGPPESFGKILVLPD